MKRLSSEITFKTFILSHLKLLAVIMISAVFIALANSFEPIFDPLAWWLLTDDIPGAVLGCWPLFAYVGGVTVFLCLGLSKSDVFSKKIVLWQDIASSLTAGFLEELGYRCIFILTAIIGITIINFLTLGFVMWFWENIGFLLVNLFTLGLMHDFIYAPYSAVFVAGALSANSAFADGHKYQGLFGHLNSWYVGLYLLVVAVTQGLVVAIIVHAVYDLITGFIRFGFQEYFLS